MRAVRIGLALILVVAQGRAHASKGSGSGERASWTAPVTKDYGVADEASERTTGDTPIQPRHGLMGAPGAAQDAEGPSRLGPHVERAGRPSYGEEAHGQGTGQTSQTWHSGDRVRSPSSADVRAARQQQAPDLEWAKGAR
jgi:hypothetical protein